MRIRDVVENVPKHNPLATRTGIELMLAYLQLEEIRAAGFNVPQYAIDALLEEAEQPNTESEHADAQ